MVFDTDQYAVFLNDRDWLSRTSVKTMSPDHSHGAAGKTDNASRCKSILLKEHAALRAMLESILLMVKLGPQENAARYFDVMRAMLFYIDEFPEKRHHPKESRLLFPKLAQLAPEVSQVIEKLETDHARGEARIRSLQQHLVAWEMLGDSRRDTFATAARDYVAFYLEHMRLEETVLLPAAMLRLAEKDWIELCRAFEANCDPFAEAGQADENYDRLYTKIVTYAPAPIGLGKS